MSSNMSNIAKRALDYKTYKDSIDYLQMQINQQHMMVGQLKNMSFLPGNRAQQEQAQNIRNEQIDKELQALRLEKIKLLNIQNELERERKEDDEYRMAMSQMREMQSDMMKAMIESEYAQKRYYEKALEPQVILLGAHNFNKYPAELVKVEKKSKKKAKKITKQKKVTMPKLKKKKPSPKPKSLSESLPQSDSPLLSPKVSSPRKPSSIAKPATSSNKQISKGSSTIKESNKVSSYKSIDSLPKGTPFNPDTDKILIKIHSCENLPDNVNVTVVVCFVVTSSSKVISGPFYATPKLQSDVYNPQFEEIIEFDPKVIEDQNEVAFLYTLLMCVDDMPINPYSGAVLGLSLMNIMIKDNKKNVRVKF